MLLVVSPAFADAELGHSGKVGQHSLNDFPSMVCVYDANAHLKSFEVTAPNVYARNTTSGRDHGKVGWRFIIKRRIDATTTRLYRSPIWTATAYDDQKAAFVMKTAAPAIPNDGYSPGAEFTVIIKMFWYSSAGVRIGTATHAGESYVERASDNSEYVLYPCFWHLL